MKQPKKAKEETKKDEELNEELNEEQNEGSDHVFINDSKIKINNQLQNTTNTEINLTNVTIVFKLIIPSFFTSKHHQTYFSFGNNGFIASYCVCKAGYVFIEFYFICHFKTHT